MLNMSVTEIARLLQESEYKREIDELGTRYAGIDLIEMALNANLANTYRTMIKITQAGARDVLVAYLRHYHLDRNYYVDLIKAAQGTDIPVVLFNRLVRMEIDVQNLDSLLRLKRDEADPAAVLDHMIPGGYEIPRGDLARLASLTWAELLAALEKYSYYEALRERIARLKEGESLRDVETALYKRLAERAFSFSAAYPLSVLPIMGFIFSKRIEVDNIRTIVRGKTSGLADDVIQRTLVL